MKLSFLNKIIMKTFFLKWWKGLVLIGFVTTVFIFLSGKFPRATVTNSFGVFCIECRGYEKVRGVGIYGFGLVYCNGKVNRMTYDIDYNKIENFKSLLKNNGFISIADKVQIIERNLKDNEPKKYRDALNKYIKEIELLTPDEKEIVFSFL